MKCGPKMRKPEWRIYYSDGTVARGTTAAQAERTPKHGVQYIVFMQTYPDGRRPWRGVDDRQIWTGEHVYHDLPFAPGLEWHGELISDEAYHAMWDRAAYGND